MAKGTASGANMPIAFIGGGVVHGKPVPQGDVLTMRFNRPLPGRKPGGDPAGRTVNGGLPSAAGPMGSAVTTPELVRARFHEAQESNPFTIIGNETNRRGWVPMDVDRPTVIVSLNSTPAAIAGDINGRLLYNYGRRPSDDAYSQWSFGPGLMYFSHPGRWWFKLQDGDGSAGGGASKQVDLIAHDASDPGVLARWLVEPGNNGTLMSPTVTISSAVAAANIVTKNRNRTGIWIQNLTPTVACRLTFDDQIQTVSPLIGPRIGGTGPSDLFLGSDFNVKGHIQAILEVAGPSAEFAAVEMI